MDQYIFYNALDTVVKFVNKNNCKAGNKIQANRFVILNGKITLEAFKMKFKNLFISFKQ